MANTKQQTNNRYSKIKGIALGLFALVVGSSSFLLFSGRALAACTAPGTDYGTVSTSLSVPGAATYRIWSRVMVPDSSNNSYLLEIDGGNCYNVGGTGISANSWTWVDYRNASTTNKVQQSLSQGSHSVKLIGNKPGVKVDRVIAISDTNCVPTGFGDNCNIPDDTTPPSVTLTAPAEGIDVSGTVNVTANASDNTSISKVDFYDNSTLISSDNSSPYAASWNTTGVPNGSHVVTARAYDSSNNNSADTSTVNVRNGDATAPSTPGNVRATATAYNVIKVDWNASTDNIGVTGYIILRDSVPVATLGNVTTYNDSGRSANTQYSYQVQAVDAAGNKSSASGKATATTPTVADSQPPSKPTNLAAKAVSTSQINLSWTASTDNIGVTTYDIYRSNGGGGASKIGNSTKVSFGDSNLNINTEYSYYVVAKDASNNTSGNSDTATAKTLSQAPPTGSTTTPPSGSSSGQPSTSDPGSGGQNTNPDSPATPILSSIQGVIRDEKTKKPIPFSRVIVSIGSNRHIYQAERNGRYAIFNLTPGRYNLTSRATNYFSKTTSVILQNTPMTQNENLVKK